MRGTAFAIACALLLAGCGGSSPQLAPIERDELHGFVDRARTAARAGDLPATTAALEALQARVRELRGAGRLDREAADRLLKYSSVTQLRARTTLGSVPPAPVPVPAPAAGASEAEAPAGGDGDDGDDGVGAGNDKDKGKGKGKGKGNGNGNGKAKD